MKLYWRNVRTNLPLFRQYEQRRIAAAVHARFYSIKVVVAVVTVAAAAVVVVVVVVVVAVVVVIVIVVFCLTICRKESLPRQITCRRPTQMRTRTDIPDCRTRPKLVKLED